MVPVIIVGLDGETPFLGQNAANMSLPVVLASDQPAVAVTAATFPLPSGASTEATLALIKAKTDNLDVALSTRTKAADQQHVVVDSSASVPVTGPVTDAQLRASSIPVSVTALVDDTVPSYPPSTPQTLSLSTDGRLRVVTAGESFNFSPWGEPERYEVRGSFGALTAW